MSTELSNLERYQEFVDSLELIDDEDMRFEYIIDIGKRANDDDFPEVFKVDANLMHGCMSKVWIADRIEDGRHYFSGFSDAIIVKGLVTMMIESKSFSPSFSRSISWCASQAMELDLPLPAECWMR